MKVLNVAGELLEGGRGGAAAAGAGGDHRHEAPKAHALQQFLRDLHFEGPVAAGLGRERDADGVADPLLQQNAERRRRGDDALRPHARLGQPEMERKLGPRRQHGIDRDQILHRAHLCREHDAVGPEPDLHGTVCAQQRRLYDRLVHHRARVARLRERRVLVHQPREQVLIEASPIHADPHRLAVTERDLDDLGELLVALVLETDIAGIDAIFVECLRRTPDARATAYGRCNENRR